MLQDLFHAATVNDASKVAVVDVSRRITYGELQKAAQNFGARLRSLGAKPGDRVVVQMPNCVEAAVALWGTLEAACVMIPLHAGLKGEALGLTLENADPHWLVTSLSDIATATPISGENSSELAALIYTSGSTGEPKGVMLTHGNMTAAIRMVNGYLKIAPSDVIHSALPLSSSYGLYQLLLALAAGATVLLDRSFAFPATCLAFAARERATIMACVPTMLGWMANSPLLDKHDLSALRMLTSAAAALPPVHALCLRERLPQARLFIMYGQTECKRISWLDPDDLTTHADSVGRGLEGQEHRIVDEQGAVVAAGEVGELVVRGPHVMRGYWRRPSETVSTLRCIVGDSTPWMHTGDAFNADSSGYLRFVGRRDELMKIGGHKVSPGEIENLLCQLPGVLEAAVVGVSDDHWGQVAAAYIVKSPDSDLSPADLHRFCSQRLPGYMVPRAFRFEADLPKTASGKVLKRELTLSAPMRPNPSTSVRAN